MAKKNSDCRGKAAAVNGSTRHKGFDRPHKRLYLALWGIVLAGVVVISCGQIGRSLFAGTDLLRGSCRLPRGEHFFFIEVVVQEGRWAALRSELREGWNPFENYSTDPFCPSSPRRAARTSFHRRSRLGHLPCFTRLDGRARHRFAPLRGRGHAFLLRGGSLLRSPLGHRCVLAGTPRGGFLIGAAACCLGLSEGAKKTSWLVAFGLIGSAAVWARQVTGVYLFVACGPVLGVALFGIVLHSATPWRKLFRIVVAVGLPICLLVGYFIVPRETCCISIMGWLVMATSPFPCCSSSLGKQFGSLFQDLSLRLPRF